MDSPNGYRIPGIFVVEMDSVTAGCVVCYNQKFASFLAVDVQRRRRVVRVPSACVLFALFEVCEPVNDGSCRVFAGIRAHKVDGPTARS